jgi:hypothetical protein
MYTSALCPHGTRKVSVLKIEKKALIKAAHLLKFTASYHHAAATEIFHIQNAIQWTTGHDKMPVKLS